MENKHVADIMIPLDNYPHIPYWFTLRQAIVEMQNFQLEVEGKKSLPRVLLVFDEAYQLLGTARRRDIMRGLEPPVPGQQDAQVSHEAVRHRGRSESRRTLLRQDGAEHPQAGRAAGQRRDAADHRPRSITTTT